MSQLSVETVRRALEHIRDPMSDGDVLRAGLISGLTVRGGKVGFMLTIQPGQQAVMEPVRLACERAVKALPGVESVTAVLTAEHAAATPATAPPLKAAQWNREPIAGVHKIIAIASGKGGVGKSTTAVGLAHALMQQGKRVGLLDADIYGPSLPRMLGLSGKPEVRNDKIVPLQAYGIKCLSMGLVAPSEGAVVWRGPMISKALHQFLRLTDWGGKDGLHALLIDMPPGTGDTHLSLAQQAPIDGAIIVTTPQEVAVMDARKALDMFRKVGVEVLGVVENMSYFTDPSSGQRTAIFGEGGGRRLAQSEGVAFLGEVPIDIGLRAAGDTGQPPPASALGHYQDIVKQLGL